MLIGCITGPDFETAKSQVALAAKTCDGVEFRADILKTDINPLLQLASGIKIVTGKEVLSADYLTIEWDDPKEYSDIRTIRAYHNFDETPMNLEAILAAMPKADLYKIACFAKNSIDALRMLCFVKEHQNVIGISMGPFGQFARRLGGAVGNVFNYSALGKPAAPGQLQADEMPKKKFAKIFGLIGNPIVQSPSHITHNRFFEKNGIDAIYVKLEIHEKQLPEFFPLAKKLFSGLSVTMPLKTKVLPFVDYLEEEAEAIGAVNTLTFTEEGVFGANTDARASLDGIDVYGKQVLILGTGGAARAIEYEAKRRGGLVKMLSRGSYHTAESCDVLINATPLENPIELNHRYQYVIDITISHKGSSWLKRAEELGATIISGEVMFEKQALGQFSRWLRTSSSLEYFSLLPI